MRAVVQRVTRAHVEVDGVVVGAIGTGLVVLIGVTHDDTAAQSRVLARKVHGLRILRGERSVADSLPDPDPDADTDTDAGPAAAILVISQFTLYGDARKGRRPTWAAAAPGAVAEPLVDEFVTALRTAGAHVETGVFGADMRVDLVNDGPATLVLEV